MGSGVLLRTRSGSQPRGRLVALTAAGVPRTAFPYSGSATVRRRFLTALILGLIALASLPGQSVGSAIEVQRACIDNGVIDGTYSQKDYRDALRSLTTSTDEYYNCRDVIDAARTAAAGGSSATPGGTLVLPPAGSDPLATATAAQRVAIAKAQQSAPPDLVVGGKSVRPASLGAGRPVKASISDLPTALLVATVLALIAAIGALGSLALPRVRRFLQL